MRRVRDKLCANAATLEAWSNARVQQDGVSSTVADDVDEPHEDVSMMRRHPEEAVALQSCTPWCPDRRTTERGRMQGVQFAVIDWRAHGERQVGVLHSRSVGAARRQRQ